MTSEKSLKERCKIWMDKWIPDIIWNPEEEIQQRTCFDDAWSEKTFPDQNWCFKICLWGSLNTNQYEWQMTPNCILIKNLHWNGKKLWHIWQGIASNYQGPDQMETLCTGNKSHDNDIFGSQELDIFLKHPEPKLETGMMVITLVRVWHQIISYAGNQNDTSWCLIQKIWSLPKGWPW